MKRNLFALCFTFSLIVLAPLNGFAEGAKSTRDYQGFWRNTQPNLRFIQFLEITAIDARQLQIRAWLRCSPVPADGGTTKDCQVWGPDRIFVRRFDKVTWIHKEAKAGRNVLTLRGDTLSVFTEGPGWRNQFRRLRKVSKATPRPSNLLTLAPATSSSPKIGGEGQRTVLQDGTLQVRKADGTIIRLFANGFRQVVPPGGSAMRPMSKQVQGADLPTLPHELAGWGDQVGDGLLDILRNIFSEAQMRAYLQSEAGSDYYENVVRRLRSISFLTQPQ